MTTTIEKKLDLAIVDIPLDNALAIFTAPNGLDPYIERLKKEVLTIVTNPNTAKGRKEIISIANMVKKSKTYLDSVGKSVVDKLKEKPKIVDAERKRMRDTLDEFFEEVRKPVTEFEEREDARIETIQNSMNAMRAIPISGKIEDLEVHLQKLKNTVIDSNFQEFIKPAEEIRTSTILAIENEIGEIRKREAEQIELEEVRKKNEALQQQLREQEIIRETEERVKKEFENETFGGFAGVPDFQEVLAPNPPIKPFESRVGEEVGDTSTHFVHHNYFENNAVVDRLTARTESINMLVSLGCPIDQATWFLDLIENNHLPNIKLIYS